MSMTIKQAFEKLTMVCGAALKNPFFVQRNLHDAFAEIAANIEGGGSDVEVTQIVTSGNKIATISVDGVGTDLYAPKASVTQELTEGTKIGTVDGTDLYAPAGGGGHNYSTTEQVVGKWADGTTDVYEKTINFGYASGGSAQSVAHGISNLGRVISIDAVGYVSSTAYSLPYVNNISSDIRRLGVDGTNITLYNANSSPDVSDIYVVMRYTKSTT